MSNILFASYDMEVGGVERSLISILSHLNYSKYNVDLMLYSHTGDFMDFLPKAPNLIDESKIYKTFRMSISQVIKQGNVSIGLARLLAKFMANSVKETENGYKQMQYMWKYSLPFLPNCEKHYDVAISYLWPHYYVSEKVKAKTKIAWIHTDYSKIDTNIKLDLLMWNKFQHIIAVSEQCKNSFINKYPELASRVTVIENIMDSDLVNTLANQVINNPMDKDKRFKLITVARLSHAKGIDIAVKALKILKDRGYNISWYVVGYGGEERKIKSIIKDNNLENSFFLLGKQINPYPYIKEADLYVQPSRYEGKAVTVGEAQILAKPVLITNYPTACSQLIEGIDGSICELSSEGIADGIEKLYSNQLLRKSLSNNCAKSNYNNDQELEKLYKLV